MQEVFRSVGPSEGPIFLISPLVHAHYEETYRLGIGKRVGDVLEEKIVPT
jgi:hypothetical protein